ncbi:MAG: methyl-accepting chemotaxis protein [Candidatus Omnitrophota bacterium]|jgi:methyl-accepting chemotaxis protein
MENDMRKRRKIRIVKMEFQRAFILKFCAVIVLSALIILVIVYLLSLSSTTTVFENSRLMIKSTADFVLPLLILSSLVSIVAAGTVTFIITLFISHRIAGPIYRLEKDIEEANNGNLAVNIQVRKKDELQNLAKSLNRMIKFFRGALAELNEELEGIPESSLAEKDKNKLENARGILKKFKC